MDGTEIGGPREFPQATTRTELGTSRAGAATSGWIGAFSGFSVIAITVNTARHTVGLPGNRHATRLSALTMRKTSAVSSDVKW